MAEAGVAMRAVPRSFGPMMAWIMVGLGALALAFALWWPMRGYVRIRRKDCCGKGCGCLFPAKPPPPKSGQAD